jgi:hypothetical protein
VGRRGRRTAITSNPVGTGFVPYDGPRKFRELLGKKTSRSTLMGFESRALVISGLSFVCLGIA